MTEYKKDIETISVLLKSCCVAFEDAIYINDLLINKKEYLTNLELLNRAYDAIYSQLILDLYKLCKENEDYSIPKLLNKLTITYKSLKWQNKVDIDDLREFKCKFQNDFFNKTLNQICEFRDWYFAHLDRKRRPTSLSHYRVRKQLALIDKAVNTISYGLIGKSYIFDSDEYRENLGYNLINYHTLKQVVYDYHANGKDYIDTQQLLQIIRNRE